jgi:hypothetical protein
VPPKKQFKISGLQTYWFMVSQYVKFFDKNGVNHRTKKAPLTGGGMGAGQISLPYEGIVRQRVRKLLSRFEIISTVYTLEPGDYFLWAKVIPKYLYQ